MSRRNGRVVFADRNGMGAGKGDFPRNISEQFRTNLDKVAWSKDADCPECKHVLCTCK
jgi:hypothetical protein